MAEPPDSPEVPARAPMNALDAAGRIGFGCMRLSTAAERDDEHAVAVVRAALDAGATLLDTADAYGHDDADTGHNERVVARALDAWTRDGGDRSRIVVATKGGLTRPGGRWRPDGRAKHLTAACAASRAALGVACIDLYQLHAVDPRTALATSVRALARLQKAGHIRHVGLCNVTVGQIRAARSIVEIASVQVALSPGDPTAVRSGVLEYCRDHGIMLMAHTPLGGAAGARRLARAASRAATRAEDGGADGVEAALAWLRDLAPVVVPIPGATRVASARAAVRAQRHALDEGVDDALRGAFDARFPAVALGRRPRAERRPPADADGDVVLLMGYPAAGKTSQAEAYVARGYERLNRDVRGGRLSDLVPELDALLAAGHRRVVLDNTYPTRAARNEVVEAAWRHGVPARCVWMETSIEAAQVNAVTRMVERYGTLLDPAAMKTAVRDDPGVVPPNALMNYRRDLEPPEDDEGFTAIESAPFVRRAPAGQARAIVFEHDGVLRAPRPTQPGDVEILPGRVEALCRCHDEGWRVLGVTWQPGVDDGTLTAEAVEACLARTSAQIGIDVDTVWCPHAAGPPKCWCRRPLPGLGALLIARHGLDPARCRFVGRGAADRGFAERLGFEFVEADAFFAATT